MFPRFVALSAFVPLLGCAQGSELPDFTSGAGGSLATSGSSSSSSSSTSSSTGTGGAGGSGGVGGMGGSGGAGGVGGMGGSGGAGGSGGGSGGMGGAGGMGGSGGSGGMGGAGGGSPTGTLLVLAGPGAGEAHYDPAAGWATGSINLQFSAAGLAPRQDGALAVLRRQSGNAVENNELFWATWTKAGGFGVVQKVGNFGFAKDGPAASTLGVATLMTFLGTDNKHYFTQYEAGAFGPFGPMPAGMVQIQAFGPSTSALASDGPAGAYAVYAGDDAHLYYLSKSGPGGAWSPSSQAPTSLVANWLRPFAIVDADQDLRIFYVRQGDNRICMVKLITPQNAWSAEETVSTAATGLAPAVAATAEGDFVVAYRGVLNEGIYFVRGKDGAWGAVTTIEVPQTPSSAPAALPGLSGADAEVVYATGGTLKHARVNGMQATLADVPGPTNVTLVAATIVP